MSHTNSTTDSKASKANPAEHEAGEKRAEARQQAEQQAVKPQQSMSYQAYSRREPQQQQAKMKVALPADGLLDAARQYTHVVEQSRQQAQRLQTDFQSISRSIIVTNLRMAQEVYTMFGTLTSHLIGHAIEQAHQAAPQQGQRSSGGTQQPVAHPDDTVQQVARIMKQRNISVLPISDGERSFGSVTDRDVTLHLVAEGRDPQHTPVRDLLQSAAS